MYKLDLESMEMEYLPVKKLKIKHYKRFDWELVLGYGVLIAGAIITFIELHHVIL